MNEEQIIKPGKLPAEFLSYLLKEYTTSNSSVIVGPGIGKDAAVIEVGNSYLVAKTDPITFTAEDIGFYAINVNANDIACMGGIPQWFLATLLLPEGKTDAALVEKIFQQLHNGCRELGIVLCGGHTEVTLGLERPIVVGQMLGTIPGKQLIQPGGIQLGDDIILTKGLAIEGTSIIAREKYKEIEDLFSEEFAARCAGFIHDPGVSVLKDAQIARTTAKIHAMHDPTEGGVAMGLHEMAMASNKTFRIEYENLPILPESKLLCDQFDMDILGTISSGALILTLSPRFSQQVIDALESAGISASVIGKVVGNGAGVELIVENEKIEMPQYTQDEILKIYAE